MKVLTLTTLFPNKINPNFGVFIKERMKAWSSLPGNELVVVAPVPWFPPIRITKKWFNFSQIPREENIEGIKVYHPRYIVTPKIGMKYYGLSMAKAIVPFLKRLKETYDFKLIDAHYVYPDGVAAQSAAKVLNIPFVISARGTDINYFPQISKNIRNQIIGVLSSAARVIGVSSGLKKIIITYLKIDSQKIEVIGNGVDLKKFHEIEKNEAREKCELPLDKKILLCVGSLIKTKNHIELLKAIEKLNLDKLLLVIVGTGQEKRKIKGFIQNKKIENKVILKGSIAHENLKWWYSASDIFCHSSLKEGCPNVIMEALACRRPVVSTPAEGASEIITSEKIGIIADGFTAKDIEKALKKALEKTWDKEAIAEKIKDSTWENVAYKLNMLFEEVVSK